jgi:hypothetical protein
MVMPAPLAGKALEISAPINRQLWRMLYRLAETRFKLEA